MAFLDSKAAEACLPRVLASPPPCELRMPAAAPRCREGDATCPISTRGGTRLVRLVRGRGGAPRRRAAPGAAAQVLDIMQKELGWSRWRKREERKQALRFLETMSMPTK